MYILSKKILSNSMWMMLERFVGIFGVIFVMSYVAKYIGPDNFGKLAFATTLFTFVQTLTWFGNQEILFKRVSKNKKSGIKYLVNTQLIRGIIFTIISLPIIFFLFLYSDWLTIIFGLSTALATFFLTQDIYTIYNNATLNSYINAIVNIFGLIIALVVRYIIVTLELEYAYLAIPIVLVTLIPYILKKYIFNKRDRSEFVEKNKYIKYYFIAGSALVISSFSVIFYTQITSLMLVYLTSTFELGVYSTAVVVGSAWAFINSSIITSVMSNIYKERDYYESYRKIASLNMIIIIISVSVIVFLVLFGEYIIQTLYGEEFTSASKLLIILAMATTCSGLGTVSARFIIKQGDYKYISSKMLCVAFSALPISYVMIKYWGIQGAAYSVLCIEFLSLTFFNYFYQNGLIFKIHFFPFFKHALKLKH